MQDLAEKLQQMLGLTLTVSEFNRSNQRPELAQPVNVLQSLHLCLFWFVLLISWMPRMNESLSGYTPEAHVERPGAAERHKRQAARQGSRADSNLTNSKLGCQPLAGSDRWVDALGAASWVISQGLSLKRWLLLCCPWIQWRNFPRRSRVQCRLENPVCFLDHLHDFDMDKLKSMVKERAPCKTSQERAEVGCREAERHGRGGHWSHGKLRGWRLGGCRVEASQVPHGQCDGGAEGRTARGNAGAGASGRGGSLDFQVMISLFRSGSSTDLHSFKVAWVMSSIGEFLISERSFVLVSSCVVQRASKNQRAFILYPEYHINS